MTGERWRPPARDRAVQTTGWAVLITLLVGVLVSSLIGDRRSAGGLLAGEATPLMQAESLAFDFDLAYERKDHDRFVAHWRASPPDLSLTSASGRRITYDRPAAYAFWLAPFVRWSPTRGFALANAILLALVAIAAARGLAPSAGPAGVWWVALAIFGSVVFAQVYWASGGLFSFAVVVGAGLLLMRDAGGRASIAVAGALLALPVLEDPIYAVLPIAAWLWAGRGRRGALAAGFVVATGLHIVSVWWWSGGLPWVALSSFDFTSQQGFPLVDYPAIAWAETVHRLTALNTELSKLPGARLDLLLANGPYLAIGQHIGLLSGFVPLLLLPIIGARGGVRTGWLLAAVAWAALVLVTRPYTLGGAPDTLGNHAFLPLYGALLCVVGTRRTLWWGLPAAVVAGLLLAPLWRAPWRVPAEIASDGPPLSTLARELLPYETTQRDLPGGATTELQGLWIRPLDDALWVEAQRGRLVLEAGSSGALLVASARRLDAIRLDFGDQAPSQIDVVGGQVSDRLLRPHGGIGFRIDVEAAGRHPLWWTAVAHHVYRVGFSFAEPSAVDLPFEVVGERAVEDEAAVNGGTP